MIESPNPIVPGALYAQSDLGAVGIKYTRQHLRLLARKGTFPAAVKLGKGRNARNYWLGSELLKYLEKQVGERDKALADWRREHQAAA